MEMNGKNTLFIESSGLCSYLLLPALKLFLQNLSAIGRVWLKMTKETYCVN